jgi:hypothetical protein
MLSRAVMGFSAGVVVVVAEADVWGWDAWANDEAPKVAKETTLKAMPPNIGVRPRVVSLIVLRFLQLPWDPQKPFPGCTGGDLDWIAP